MFHKHQPGKLPQIDAVEIMTGGNSKITIVNTRTGNRYTYRIQCPKDKRRDTSTRFFVSVLTGNDNEYAYSYIGCLVFSHAAWRFDYGVKARVASNAPSVQGFSVIFNSIWSLYKTHPDLELWHEGTCCRCGRTLTVPESIAKGFGPECAHIRSVANRRQTLFANVK
jgi:hypothetical protein